MVESERSSTCSFGIAARIAYTSNLPTKGALSGSPVSGKFVRVTIPAASNLANSSGITRPEPLRPRVALPLRLAGFRSWRFRYVSLRLDGRDKFEGQNLIWPCVKHRMNA
jgi:hypothetical protein